MKQGSLQDLVTLLREGATPEEEKKVLVDSLSPRLRKKFKKSEFFDGDEFLQGPFLNPQQMQLLYEVAKKIPFYKTFVLYFRPPYRNYTALCKNEKKQQMLDDVASKYALGSYGIYANYKASAAGKIAAENKIALGKPSELLTADTIEEPGIMFVSKDFSIFIDTKLEAAFKESISNDEVKRLDAVLNALYR